MAFFSANRKKDRGQRLACFKLGFAACFGVGITAGVLSGSAAAGVTTFGILLGAFLPLSTRWMIAREARAPVLVYHSVSDDRSWMENTRLSIPPGVFERQLKYLADNGYKSVPLHEVVAHNAGERALENKTLALTFDDGFLDNWVAVYPLLKKHGFEGTVFVTHDFVESGEARPNLDDVKKGRANREDLTWQGYLNWNEIETMDREGTLSAESHTKTHTPLDSGAEAAPSLDEELAGARRILGERLGQKVSILCWPYDRYDEKLEEAADRAGYEATTRLNAYNRFGEHPRRLARLYWPRCRPELQREGLNFASFRLSLRLYEGNYYLYIPFLFVNLAIKLFNRFGGRGRFETPAKIKCPETSDGQAHFGGRG